MFSFDPAREVLQLQRISNNGSWLSLPQKEGEAGVIGSGQAPRRLTRAAAAGWSTRCQSVSGRRLPEQPMRRKEDCRAGNRRPGRHDK
ncbi:MAG: hypothetical protein WD230_05725, partial [Cucumibacter sp.]